MTYLRIVGWFFRQQRWVYCISILMVVVMTYLNTVPARLIGNVVDEIRDDALTGRGLQETVLSLIGVALLIYLTIYIWNNTLTGCINLLERLLRDRLFRHWTALSSSFFERNRSGELMALASMDAAAVGNTAGYGMLILVQMVTGVVVVVYSMVVFVDYRLMFTAMIPLPFLTMAVNKIGRKIRSNAQKFQETFGRMNNHVLEAVSGMRVLRSYVKEDQNIGSFERVTRDVMDANLKVVRQTTLLQPLISTLIGISYGISIGYGAYLVIESEISLGQMVTFNLYLGLLISPMMMFGDFIAVLQRGTASAVRLNANLSQAADVTDSDAPIDVEFPERIEFRGLTFRYPSACENSLRDIRFSLRKGETIGIVGSTGSGKSTLYKLILRQYPFEKEKLLINGIPIERLALDRLRSWIGYVPQEHLLLSGTVRDNIKLGKPDASDEEVLEAARQAALLQDLTGMKDGLDTPIGENGVMLSGGQKQRIGIARALLTDPEILMLDDVLSAVDSHTEREILDSIRSGSKRRMTFIATHRLQAVVHAHRILVLKDGLIDEQGTHEQLMRADGWYRRQYDRQMLEHSLSDSERER